LGCVCFMYSDSNDVPSPKVAKKEADFHRVSLDLIVGYIVFKGKRPGLPGSLNRISTQKDTTLSA